MQVGIQGSVRQFVGYWPQPVPIAQTQISTLCFLSRRSPSVWYSSRRYVQRVVMHLHLKSNIDLGVWGKEESVSQVDPETRKKPR